jgi:hypothetical protein
VLHICSDCEYGKRNIENGCFSQKQSFEKFYLLNHPRHKALASVSSSRWVASERLFPIGGEYHFFWGGFRVNFRPEAAKNVALEAPGLFHTNGLIIAYYIS